MADLPSIPLDRIRGFCERWRVREFSLFGSAIREDFRPESDIDVLVSFRPDATVSLWDWPIMVEELEAIFGRRVDLVEKEAIRNPFRRKAILGSHQVVYAA